MGFETMPSLAEAEREVPEAKGEQEQLKEKQPEERTEKIVDSEAKRFSEFSNEVEKERERIKRGTVKKEGITEKEFEKREENEKRKAERENLSEDDKNEKKVEAVKKELEFGNDIMEFQEIEGLISEGELSKAKNEIKKVEYKLQALMQRYNPELKKLEDTYDNYNSPNEMAEGARLLLHTEVLNLYRMFPDKIEAAKLEAETLKDSARFQENWDDKSGVIADCERGLEVLERMREEASGEQAYQNWGNGLSIKKQLEEMLKENKKKLSNNNHND